MDFELASEYNQPQALVRILKRRTKVGDKGNLSMKRFALEESQISRGSLPKFCFIKTKVHVTKSRLKKNARKEKFPNEVFYRGLDDIQTHGRFTADEVKFEIKKTGIYLIFTKAVFTAERHN